MITPRQDYVKTVEELGFGFHTDYWLENAYYKFRNDEYEKIRQATNECYDMYCEAVEICLRDEQKLDILHIPAEIRDFVRRSWDEDHLSLYGRFDFALINGVPKLLEFNADTPTSLFEASVVQWQWKEDVFPQADQFNHIHETLVQSWKDIHAIYNCERYVFTSITDCEEDNVTLDYILSTAVEAGLNTAEVDLGEIIIDDSLRLPDGTPIDCMFKLYPWEFMFEENLGGCATDMCWIEPLWKALMSNKAMLPILTELFPDSPYILLAYFEQGKLRSYCKKPIFSREGANVELVRLGAVWESTGGDYGKEGYVYQELADIPSFHGRYPVIGSWIVGGEACGIGIRETSSRITDNMSHFVPHILM